MRFGSTFDLVLEVVAFERQKLRDLIGVARTAGTGPMYNLLTGRS
jgi:hypothetical protein